MESFWQLLAAVFAGFTMTLFSVVIGAFVVYKTKREDGIVFSQKRDKQGGPVFIDDGMLDEEDLEPAELPEEIKARNEKFIKTFADKVSA